MRHAPEYIAIMAKLLPVLRRQKAFCVMPFDQLCDHFAYFWNRGTFVYSIDDFGVPHGACMIRMFPRIEQFLEPYIHEPVGKFCVIDLLVADTPVVAANLFSELTHRWGPQEVMMWDRDERTENGAPRMYRWDQFMKLSSRLTYGIIEYGKLENT
jgi:hypothetical protein